MTRKLTEKEKEVYWQGFEQGKKNSLKHNLCLLKGQLKAQKEYLKNAKKIKKYNKLNKTKE